MDMFDPVPDGSRTCWECRRVLPMEEFHRDKNRKDGHAKQCKDCKRDASKQHRRTHPEMHRKYNRRQTLKGHGLTPDQYDAMVEQQGGLCLICGTDAPGGRGVFHVDHDHSCCPGPTGCPDCVRGLLCNNCNQGLGKFNDNITLLLAAVDYLTVREKLHNPGRYVSMEPSPLKEAPNAEDPAK